MSYGHHRNPSLRQTLINVRGVPAAEVEWYIFSRIFPWPARLWRMLRLLFGADPCDPGSAFVADVADAASIRDLLDAFETYRHNPLRRNTGFCRWFKLTPSRHRVLQFFAHVMVARDGLPGE